VNAFNPQTEELFYVAGDKPAAVQHQHGVRSPDARDAGLLGHQSSVRLDKAALGHPLVRYRDRVIEADVYPFLDGDNDPGADQQRLEVLLICPCCENQILVTSDRKAIEWIPGQPEIDPSTGQVIVRGLVSIEPFTCPWEKDTKAAVTGHGENLCRWRAGIDKGVARDA
jgi:hypothetical protein